MITIELKEFKILSTGVDGGHHYISSEIEYKGAKRRITILFATKYDEQLLMQRQELTVKGNLINDGNDESLLMVESEIIGKYE